MEQTKRKYQKHKTDVKITVKHFLNTELKPDIDKNTGSLLYPLYIRVGVNRQLTKLRSRLNYLLPIEDLEQFLSLTPIEEYVENERLIIEQTISNERPEQKDTFKLTQWSDRYRSGLDSLGDTISTLILNDIDFILRYQYHWTEAELNRIDRLTIPEIFVFLSREGVTDAQSVQEQYGVLLETTSYQHIVQAVDNVAFDFCLWDVVNGFFQNRLLKSKIPIASDYMSTLNKVLPSIEI